MNENGEFISMSPWKEMGLERVEDRVYRGEDGKYYIEPLMAPGIGTGQLISVGKKKPTLNGSAWFFEKEEGESG